ncbi:MAG: hypothetical protein ACE5SW_06635 [Nitrososphaeraceae archaeon]
MEIESISNLWSVNFDNSFFVSTKRMSIISGINYSILDMYTTGTSKGEIT